MRRHTALDSRGIQHLLRPLPRRRRWAVDRRTRRLRWVRRGIAGPVVSERGLDSAVIAACGLGLLGMAMDTAGLPVLMPTAILAGSIFITAWIMYPFSKHARRSPEWILIHVAAMRLCPCCGYSLRELNPADDGCTVCPECGAAWWLAKRLPAP